MCYAPVLLPNGNFAGCRECSQCKDKRIDDWVGRCAAEAQTSAGVSYVTLTYGRDEHGNEQHKRSQLLVYEDVQKAIRAIRDSGWPVRFFVVGEHGTAKGRSHWHAMLFWVKRKPTFDKPDSEGRVWVPWWPHGHINIDDVSSSLKSIRYACKYIQKDSTQQKRVGYSTKPALGEKYFLDLAAQHVREGLAPRDLSYTFPDHRNANGERKRYYMHRGIAEKFLAKFVALWTHERPGQPIPDSEPVEMWLDRNAQIALESMAMEDWLNEKTKAKEKYETRLAALRQARYERDVQAEKAEDERKRERERLRTLPAPVRAKSVARLDVGGHVNGPKPDQTQSLYTDESMGFDRLRRRRP